MFISRKTEGPQIPNEYAWLVFYDKLADGDVTKYEQVGELNYVLCLNKLSLMQMQDEIQEWHMKRANKK